MHLTRFPHPRQRLWLMLAVAGALAACARVPSSRGEAAGGGPGAPANLRCEYLRNPLGLDEKAPRLSWEVNDSRRGALQSAYQVLVAGSEAALRAGTGEAWDSGKVASGQSVHVPYAGQALQARRRYYWKVRTWDGSGRPSPWSAPAFWEMGLMAPSDWTAKWITPAAPVEAAKPGDTGPWIWHPGGEGRKRVFFRASLTLPADAAVGTATASITCDNGCTLWVNGRQVGQGNDWSVLQRYDVAKALVPGRNVVAVEGVNSDGPAGLRFGLKAKLRSGGEVSLLSGADWLCSEQAGPDWQATSFDDRSWVHAAAVAKVGEGPWANPGAGPRLRSVCLRKAFTVGGKVARARAYVTGLGSYVLSVNGRRVSADVFNPGWTTFRKRVMYQTYDVTPLLKPGENAAGAILGNGWWSGRPGSGGQQLFLFGQIEIEYADGKRQVVATDDTWKSHPSPVLENTFYDGESYDARLELPGWDGPAFSDGNWDATAVAPSPTQQLDAQVGPTLRVTEEIPVKKITQPAKGVYLFDFGQNAAGRCRLRVKAPAGTRIQLRFAEELKPDGTIYTDNYRSARATDLYICRGTGREEVWEPDFTYRGFRYAELTGYPGVPGKDALVSHMLHSAPPVTGEFRCSNRLIDAIQHNILYGQRSNMHSVPTDCPQRDERLGWMGDAQIFAQTACWNMEMSGFFTKWMKDITDSQSAEGSATDVSPGGGGGAPGWGDAITVVPWTVWQFYGDTRILERNYDGMRRWVEFMRARSKGNLYERGGYGDWIAVVGSPSEPIGSAYYFYSTKLLSEMAAALGKAEDAKQYAELAAQIAEAYNAKHLKPETGDYTGGTQTAQILPLAFGITPRERLDAVAQCLLQDITRRGGHLSTGFLGTPYINPVLTATGHHDLAYRLAVQDTYPSWGYMVRKGATTIWELWNSDKAGPGMNSRNHFALGAVGRWFYEELAGIQPAAPGFREILLRPRPAGDLRWARGRIESVYGRISCQWSLDGSNLRLDARLPANTRARICVPLLGKPDARVSEGGKLLVAGGKAAGQAEGLTFAGIEGDFAVFQAGAGSYHFTASGVGTPPVVATAPKPSAAPIISELADDFAGGALDEKKWEPLSLGLESTEASPIQASLAGGQLLLAGSSAANYWPGRTLLSRGAFTVHPGRKLTVSVERPALEAKGSGARSGLWLWVDENNSLLFAQDTEKGVWSYNADGQKGSGQEVAPASDSGPHALKMVHDGTSVRLFLDGKQVADVPVSWREGIRVGLTAQARAQGDTVSARFAGLSARVK